MKTLFSEVYMKQPDHIILGIDPGTLVMGFAVISIVIIEAEYY